MNNESGPAGPHVKALDSARNLSPSRKRIGVGVAGGGDWRMDFLDQLETFMPHGMCLLWRPELMILHIGSDALIAVAYFAIPFGIAKFVKGRTDLDQGHRRLALLFAAFIGLCGVTHVASIFVLWYPFYVTEGWLKAVTAFASVATAIFALMLVPKLLLLPSAQALQKEIDGHQATLQELQAARAALAQRVDLTESELRRVEANYEISDKLLRSVVETVPGAIYAKDEAGRMILANKSTLNFIGLPWEAVVGRRDDEFIDDAAQAEAIIANDRLILSGGGIREMEESITLPDGETRTFWSTKYPMWDDTGRAIGIVGVSVDITDRKKEESEARASIERALAEKILALEQRDILIREVYHRVKNNLQIVDSLLVLQSKSLLDARAKDGLKSLRDRVYALGLVHHQLMATTDFATFDLSSFLNELVENLAEGSGSSKVALSVSADPLTVGLDFAIPFGLLVTELVTNALKHAFPAGVGAIHVQVTNIGEGEVILLVKDDGCGANASASAGSTGSGLGKNIITSMARQLQGDVTYSYDDGTRVEVRVRGPGPK